ncbi:MAG: helix-turn-helix domain-containing protein, partial [Clostridia bacterium]
LENKNDVFNMMLCVCAKQKEFQLTAEHIASFKAYLSTIGRVEKFVVYGTDILILIAKQNLRATSDFLKIPSAATEIIHPSYACIYELNLTFEQLDETASELLGNAKYASCFASHAMTLSQIESIRRQAFHIDTYKFNVNIITGVLLNQRELVEQSVYQLYLVDIKQNLDITSIFANRRWIVFFDSILFSTRYFKNAKIDVFKNTIEHEYQYAIKFWFFIMNEIEKNPVIPVVQDCLLLILKDFSNFELSLNMIADKLVFAKSYLSRAFKSRFQITIGDFITKLRIEYACQLLENSNDAVKDISAQIGYQDPQYFSKLFYNNTGLYPKEYRKKHKEGDLK